MENSTEKTVATFKLDGFLSTQMQDLAQITGARLCKCLDIDPEGIDIRIGDPRADGRKAEKPEGAMIAHAFHTSLLWKNSEGVTKYGQVIPLDVLLGANDPKLNFALAVMDAVLTAECERRNATEAKADKAPKILFGANGYHKTGFYDMALSFGSVYFCPEKDQPGGSLGYAFLKAISQGAQTVVDYVVARIPDDLLAWTAEAEKTLKNKKDAAVEGTDADGKTAEAADKTKHMYSVRCNCPGGGRLAKVEFSNKEWAELMAGAINEGGDCPVCHEKREAIAFHGTGRGKTFQWVLDSAAKAPDADVPEKPERGAEPEAKQPEIKPEEAAVAEVELKTFGQATEENGIAV